MGKSEFAQQALGVTGQGLGQLSSAIPGHHNQAAGESVAASNRGMVAAAQVARQQRKMEEAKKKKGFMQKASATVIGGVKGLATGGPLNAAVGAGMGYAGAEMAGSTMGDAMTMGQMGIGMAGGDSLDQQVTSGLKDWVGRGDPMERAMIAEPVSMGAPQRAGGAAGYGLAAQAQGALVGGGGAQEPPKYKKLFSRIRSRLQRLEEEDDA